MIDDILWSYLGIGFIVIVGIYLSFYSGWSQILKLPRAFKIFYQFATNTTNQKNTSQGIAPLKAFFASIGGCIGIGNVVAVSIALQLGGPGALFWLWITALLGMIVKYAEVYLGILYRRPNKVGGYDGGPMFFLQKVFRGTWIPKLVSILLCIYGVEIFMFRVMTDSVVHNWGINPLIAMSILLIAVLYAARGGIERVGRISSVLIPIFMVSYISMILIVMWYHWHEIPHVLAEVFQSAFSGKAAISGIAGGTVLNTIMQGVRRACYSGDIGIGYASIVQSESKEVRPEKQASTAMLGVVFDSMICTFTILLLLVTNTWQTASNPSMLVPSALHTYFPFINMLWPIFIILLGYSTMIAFFAAGQKAAQFLSPSKGKNIYFVFAVFMLIFFSFFETSCALTIMSLSGGFLLLINLYGIFKLRKDISFNIPQ